MLDAIYQAVIAGDQVGVKEDVQRALAAGHPPAEILDQALIAAMSEIGRRYEYQECFVPEMLLAARAMQASLQVLQPHLMMAKVKPAGKVILGTVRGDLHDIGKNLVGMMLAGAGFEVIDLGVDVLPDRFVAAVRVHRPHLLGLSALLTTTRSNMIATIAALQEAGLRDQVKVMVGGAPITQEFADEIGADLYAPDAAAASRLARALLEVI
jgi:5-methyltetrahydrofolate--homocysteine methyltransferase